jgi:hypothetical protein
VPIYPAQVERERPRRAPPHGPRERRRSVADLGEDCARASPALPDKASAFRTNCANAAGVPGQGLRKRLAAAPGRLRGVAPKLLMANAASPGLSDHADAATWPAHFSSCGAVQDAPKRDLDVAPLEAAPGRLKPIR